MTFFIAINRFIAANPVITINAVDFNPELCLTGIYLRSCYLVLALQYIRPCPPGLLSIH